MLDVWPKLFTPQGESGNWGLGFPPDCITLVQGESVSQPFLPALIVGIFSFIWCEGVTQLVSGFLSELLCVAVHLECP